MYAFQLDLQSTTSFYQGYLDDQQKYQAFPSAPFCVCGCNFSYNAEYPKLIEREVSLEGRFVKLKPENVEVHWVHNPWNVRSFEMLELRQLEHNRVYSMWEFSS